MNSFPLVIVGEDFSENNHQPWVRYNSDNKYNKSSVHVDSTYFYISIDTSVEIFTIHNPFDKILTLICHTSSVTRMVSDSNYLYTASKDQTIKIWDKTNNFELVKVIHVPSTIYYLTIDNHYIYGSDFTEKIYIWDILNDFNHFVTLTCTDIFFITALYSDNDYLYVGSNERVFQVRAIHQNFTLVKTLVGTEITEEVEEYLVPGEDETEWVLSLFSDQKYLYSGTGDGIIKVWDIQDDFKLLKTFERQGVIQNLQTYANYLFCSTWNFIKIWDTADEFNLVHTFESPSLENNDRVHFDLVNSIAVNAKHIYSIMTGGNLHIWESTRPFKLMYNSNTRRNEYYIFNDCDSQYIYSLEPFTSIIKIYQYDPVFKLVGAVDFGYKVNTPVPFHPNYRNLPIQVYSTKDYLFVYHEQKLQIYDKSTTFDLLLTINSKDVTKKPDKITAVHADEKYLYIGFSNYYNGSIGIFDLATDFSFITLLIGHKSSLTVLFSNSNLLFSGTGTQKHGDIMIWDVKDNFKIIKTPTGAPSYPTRTDPIKNLIKANLNTVDTESPKTAEDLLPWIFKHDARITCLYADDRYLYVGTEDKLIMVFDGKHDFTLLSVLKGHDSEVINIMAFKGYLYSGSGTEIIVWDVQDIKKIKILRKEIGRSSKELEGFMRCVTTSLEKEFFNYTWSPSEGIILSRTVSSDPNQRAVEATELFGTCVEQKVGTNFVLKIHHT